MGHSKALKLKSAVTGAYCQMMYAHSGRRKPSLFARGSEGATVCFEFNTRRSRPRPSPDRGREGESATPDFGSARPRPREIDLSPRYVHQEAGLAKPCPVCRTPGCPAVGLSLALPSFVWGGGVGVGQLPRKSSGHYARARRSPLSVLPLQKSDGEGALNFTGHAAGRLVRVRVRRRASRTPFFLHFS